MPPTSMPRYLEPLARVLADNSVTTLFLNGPMDVRLERLGRIETTQLPVTIEDIEELATEVIRRASRRPGQVMASCQLEQGWRAELVLSAAVEGGRVLVLSREKSRPRGIDELFGPGAEGSAGLAALRQQLAQRRGILVVGPSDQLRSSFLLALVEDLPPQERVIVVDRGLFLAPRHPHLVRLLVDPASGATRAKLVEAVGVLRAQRLVIDEVCGSEIRDLLLGEGDGFEGAVVGVAGTSLEAGLERIRALALVELGPSAEPDPLVRSRFGMVLLLGESGWRRPAVLQQAELRVPSGGDKGLPFQLVRQRISGEAALLSVTAPSTGPPPERLPLPDPPSTRDNPPVVTQVAPDAGRGSLRTGEPRPAAPIRLTDGRPSEPTTRTPAPRPERSVAPAPGGPPPTATPADQRLHVRTLAVTRPGDIFEEMLAALPDLQQPATPTQLRPPSSAADEIDDSLLFGDQDDRSFPPKPTRTR